MSKPHTVMRCRPTNIADLQRRALGTDTAIAENTIAMTFLGERESPSALATGPEEGESSTPPTAPLEARELPSRRVAFVIDDSEDARELYGDALRSAGYRVFEARDGREAQDLLLEHPTPTAIVLDLLMPNMDGYELLDLIRSYRRLLRIPTLVVTATPDQVELGVPFSVCLRKPVGGAAVVEALEELIFARMGDGR
jgi:CheY-like chemotaxis protein